MAFASVCQRCGQRWRKVGNEHLPDALACRKRQGWSRLVGFYDRGLLTLHEADLVRKLPVAPENVRIEFAPSWALDLVRSQLKYSMTLKDRAAELREAKDPLMRKRIVAQYLLMAR